MYHLNGTLVDSIKARKNLIDTNHKIDDKPSITVESTLSIVINVLIDYEVAIKNLMIQLHPDYVKYQALRMLVLISIKP